MELQEELQAAGLHSDIHERRFVLCLLIYNEVEFQLFVCKILKSNLICESPLFKTLILQAKRG